MDYELAKQLKDAGFPQEGENCLSLQTYRGDICERQYHSYEDAEKRHKKDCSDWDCREIQNCDVYVPTLSELIEACGEDFEELVNLKDKWISYGGGIDIIKGVEQWHAFGEGSTPEEAVACLWLELNK